jgi:hypothetical protein
MFYLEGNLVVELGLVLYDIGGLSVRDGNAAPANVIKIILCTFRSVAI